MNSSRRVDGLWGFKVPVQFGFFSISVGRMTWIHPFNVQYSQRGCANIFYDNNRLVRQMTSNLREIKASHPSINEWSIWVELHLFLLLFSVFFYGGHTRQIEVHPHRLKCYISYAIMILRVEYYYLWIESNVLVVLLRGSLNNSHSIILLFLFFPSVGSQLKF